MSKEYDNRTLGQVKWVGRGGHMDDRMMSNLDRLDEDTGVWQRKGEEENYSN